VSADCDSGARQFRTGELSDDEAMVEPSLSASSLSSARGTRGSRRPTGGPTVGLRLVSPLLLLPASSVRDEEITGYGSSARWR
jgi:hypothetical protein